MSKHTPSVPTQSKPLLRPTIATLTLALALGGCTAFEGVNVGANIPIGGIGGVGVNKTIGQGQNPAPQQAPQPSEQNAPPSSEESAEAE